MTSPLPTPTARPITCPACEADELRFLSHASARCASCGVVLNGTALQTLRQIVTLPDVFGNHPCECGHPEMRRLPDGVFRCPSCHAEVLPISFTETFPAPTNNGKAYWSGWLDGRFGDTECFTENERLANWQDAATRLDYYRGHRAGSLERRPKDNPASEAA